MDTLLNNTFKSSSVNGITGLIVIFGCVGKEFLIVRFNPLAVPVDRESMGRTVQFQSSFFSVLEESKIELVSVPLVTDCETVE